MKGERALRSEDEDKLGFRDVAKRIASSLVDRASEDGLVIGIEGTWGSGKSSLLFLIVEELGKLPKGLEPTVISFQPWLIGKRDALIESLFGELSKQLDQIALGAGDAAPTTVRKAKKAAEALRNFMGGLSKAGATIEVIGEASGFSLLKLFGKGVKAGGELAKQKKTPPQLSELKDNLVRSLRELGHRFIVTIDDVDRPEPSEVIEVLRLVRSVADLPNVIYLLCYDGGILAHSIQQAARVESGQAYLEKIVQLTVMVPKPEPLQLRQWLTDELHLIASVKNDDERSRLNMVVDYEGGRQLVTPRAVVRTLDAIRFYWPPLRDLGADLADLLWLQLIKNGNPPLYRWIEEYCATAAVVSLGIARLDDAEKEQQIVALLETMDDDHFNNLMYRHYFADQLPGVEPDHAAGSKGLKVFEPVSEQERVKAICNKRLASPDHYRLYFALSGPSHALTSEDFALVLEAAQANAEQTATGLLQLHNEQIAGSLTKADLLLERIGGDVYLTLASEQSKNLLLALSQAMDEAYELHPFDQTWLYSLWDRARKLVPLLLSPLNTQERAALVTSMFSEGAAIGWLTKLLRRETFAHGRYGDRPRPEDDWLFTNPELDKITDLMLSRYRTMTSAEVYSSPNPLGLLFAWRQGGDEDGPRQFVQSTVDSDEGLVDTLEHFTSTVQSSRGYYTVLTRVNVSPFLDYDDARQKVRVLTEHHELGERAKRLAAAFDEADD